jgi:toxin CcdB
MPRLDVHPMPGLRSQGYVVNVQADLLDHLASRVVVPLLPEAGAPKAISELNPVFDIQGGRYVLVTQAIASIPLRELKPAMASLAAERDAITRALDVLTLGF